jgi:hypothetical protein
MDDDAFLVRFRSLWYPEIFRWCDIEKFSPGWGDMLYTEENTLFVFENKHILNGY